MGKLAVEIHVTKLSFVTLPSFGKKQVQMIILTVQLKTSDELDDNHDATLTVAWHSTVWSQCSVVTITQTPADLTSHKRIFKQHLQIGVSVDKSHDERRTKNTTGFVQKKKCVCLCTHQPTLTSRELLIGRHSFNSYAVFSVTRQQYAGSTGLCEHDVSLCIQQ